MRKPRRSSERCGCNRSSKRGDSRLRLSLMHSPAASLGGPAQGQYKAGMGVAKLPRKAASGPPKKKPARVSAKAAARVQAIFERFAAALPEPKGKLEYINHFTLL